MEPVAPVAAVTGGVSPSLSPRLDSLPLPAALLTGEGDPGYALPTPPEPGYSAVAPHVAASLRGLLDELDLPERHKPQGEALRERLEGGLNWYELVPVLDDLAVLVLAVTNSEHRDFAIYLKQLNERLVAFVASISAAQEGYSETLESARVLDDQLREQVSDLQSRVQDATDLDDLKRAVEKRLDGLLSTMNDYQRQRAAREEEVGGRLKMLVDRVATMEQEASAFRDHLEEQRQKALSDPSPACPTGPPGASAWSWRWRAGSAMAASCCWPCWTSTTSSASTTTTATWPATRCSRSSPARSPSACARPTSSPASAARSSSC